MRGDGPGDAPGDGMAVVDKAPGWTSHDVVAKARGVLGTRKVGHAGTLDPDATGVLVLGVGKGTKLLRFATAMPKSYTCEVVLGVETDTLDASGAVVATHDMGPPEPQAILAAAAALTGPIEQIPPMVSAVQVDGRRLHELARAGIVVEREPRPVVVHSFVVQPSKADPMVLDATVECSSGTYVRTLAADLGAALGGGAHLRNLRRTAIGGFSVADARPIDEVELRPVGDLVAHLPRREVQPDVADAVKVGKVLEPEAIGAEGGGPWAVFDLDGELLAVYEVHRGRFVKPAVVVAHPAAAGR